MGRLKTGRIEERSKKEECSSREKKVIKVALKCLKTLVRDAND